VSETERLIDAVGFRTCLRLPWSISMHLHEARLCLDCEELHMLDRCPQCASDAFAFVTRWIPASERRRSPPPLPALPSHRVRWLTGAISVVFAAFRLWKGQTPTQARADADAPPR
jgi:hypothetical protein